MAYSGKVKYFLRTASFQQGKNIYRNQVLTKLRDAHTKANAEASIADSSEGPLVDLYGRKHDYLRISLTERCNLRCQYCMPAEGVQLSARSSLLTREELMSLVRVFAALGVRKVRLTGGEPTLRADLVEIVQELNDTPGIQTIAMTSNGLALTRRLPALQRAGLSALNLSLDSLRADRFERMARRPGLSHVLASLDLALQLGFPAVKINTVLMKGFNDDEICDFVELTRDRDVDVRFIEFMPFSGNRWDDTKMVSEDAALDAVRNVYPGLVKRAPTACNTATMWQVPGHAGRIGFISSMTKPFCSSCNRLRLTADGNLKVCLFGSAETSLRDAVRGGANKEELTVLLRAALRRKMPQHAAAAPAPPVRMYARAYSTRADEPPRRAPRATFSHIDEEGHARMVDVGAKPVTARTAEAECYLTVGARLLRLLRSTRLPKGDALTVAQVAGALAAKRTSDLIPLCHPLPLELARVRVELPRATDGERGGRVRLSCECKACARTGVEMEALTGCAVAALALYDMCKSVDKRMTITDLRVVSKTGGASGDWPTDGGTNEEESNESKSSDTPRVRAHDTSPLKPDETYVPTNLMHF